MSVFETSWIGLMSLVTTILLGLPLPGSPLLGSPLLGSPTLQEEKKLTSAEDPLNDDLTRAMTERLKIKCLEELQQLVDDFPDQAQPQILMSRYFARLGDGERALQHLETALEHSSEDPEIYVGMGWVEWKRRSGKEAAKWWSKALELNPELPNIRNYLARVLLSLDRSEEAIPLLKEDLKRQPSSHESQFLMGQIYQINQDYEKAKEAYEQTLALYPTFANAHYCLATVCARLGQMDLAKEYRLKFRTHRDQYNADFDTSILSFDDLSSVSVVLSEILRGAAEVYLKGQKPERAEELWQFAIDIHDKDIVSRRQYANYALRSGKLDKAKELFTALAEAEPREFRHALNLGKIAAQQKDFEEAEKRFRTICDLQPGNPIGYRSLAQLYLQFQKKLPQAKDYAQSCTNLAPTAPHYYLLGVACARNGDRPGAISNIQKAVDLAPNNSTYRQVLQQLSRNP